MRSRRRSLHRPRRRVRFYDALGLHPRLTSGSVSIRHCDGVERPRQDLVDLDARAFDGYRGSHDILLADRGHLLLADAPRALVGYVLLLPPPGDGDAEIGWYLDTVAVVPERQGEGLGTLLASAALDWLREMGIEQVRSSPLVGADEEKRAAWLRGLGFVDVRVGMVAVLGRAG